MDGEHALKSTLRRVRRRWFAIEWSRVAARTALAAAVAVCAAGLVERLTGVRGGALAALACGVAAVTMAVAWLLAWPLRRRPTDRQVARYVEERCPELEDRIASAAEILGRRERRPFDALVLGEAGRRAAPLDLDRVVPRRVLRRRFLELAASVLVLAAAGVAFRPAVGDALWTLRYLVFPPSLTLEVQPGDVRTQAGGRVAVRARIAGAPEGWPVPEPVLQVRIGTTPQTLAFERDGHGFRAELAPVRASGSYRVVAGGLASPDYRIDVRHPPRVARIDLAYSYPSFTGLKPRIEEDGGDIFAPAGTRVRLRVTTEGPVEQGEMALGDGQRVALAPAGGRALEGEITVKHEGSYRVALRDPEGLSSRGDTEYFIRVMDDRPPDVRLVRPSDDRRVTRLEEVVVEARADDDHGVRQLDLVVAVRGDRERVVPLHRGAPATAVSGAHTLFLEELDVQPGDFVTYYARARDVGRGKRSTEVRSDIFFLEVRPFTEEFEAAQSQAFMPGGGSNFDDLAARQKEVVIATWKLERRSAAGRSRPDIDAIARAQAEVRGRAEALAQRMRTRPARRARPGAGQPSPPPALPQAGSPMQLAVEAMSRAERALGAYDTRDAVPHEMEALNQLLRAQADVRRTQVARQQSGAGGGGQTGNQDLSALFDRELQRQQETNYENRPSAAPRGGDARNSALDKLRELARRQDDLSRRQQELGRRREQMTEEEAKRQLERLTREQAELQRRAEQLARSMSGEEGASSSSTSGEDTQRARDAVRQAAEDMRRAAGDLQEGRAGEAGGKGARAADRLRDAEREASAPGANDRQRAAGDLQLDLQQLAEAQRRLARDAGGSPGSDGWRRLAAEQERLAEAADRAMRSARELSSGAGQGDAVRRAAQGLDRDRIGERMRGSARDMRRAADASGDGTAPDPTAVPRTAQQLADALDRAARGLSPATGRDGDEQRLAERLARARDAREQLAALEREIERRTAAAAGRPEGERASGSEGGPPRPAIDGGEAEDERRSRGDRAGEQAAAPGARGGGEGSGSDRGGADLQELQREYARRLQAARRALDEARADLPELGDGLSTPTEWTPSRSAPGTEAFKQDFARWDELRRDVATALERAEAALAARLNARTQRERLAADADDRAPDAYRRQNARYYESLTRKDRQ